ncbi:MAG TPA: hypothetical protein VJA21_31100 [Verrucomicrobiae bacterium]
MKKPTGILVWVVTRIFHGPHRPGTGFRGRRKESETTEGTRVSPPYFGGYSRYNIFGLSCLLLAALLIAQPGCTSKPRPDWNQRIGNLTFEEAVQELGPPASSTPLEDGTRAAEWFLKPGPQISFGLGTAASTERGGVAAGQSVALPTKGHYLRLAFGPDGKLQRWEKFRR